MNIIKILDRPIAFQRPFVTLTGSIASALFLSQAVYWQNRCTDDEGWWFKTGTDWEEETGLSRRERDNARKDLEGILECALHGVPARLYFRLNAEKLSEALASLPGMDKLRSRSSKLARGGQASLPGVDKLVCTTSSKLHIQENKQQSTNMPPSAACVETEFKKFVRLWEEAYQRKYGTRYLFNGGRDAKSIKQILALNKGTVEEIIKFVKTAWISKGFWCEKLVTINQLLTHWNELQQEVKKYAPTDYSTF